MARLTASRRRPSVLDVNWPAVVIRQVEFRVLGPLDVRDSGSDLTPGSAHQRRLLTALLVYHPQVVSTDRLLDVLWGDSPPSTALKTLRTYLSRLRAALAPAPSHDAAGSGAPAVDQSLIVTRSPGYQLSVAPERIDARRFESLLERARQDITDRPRDALAMLDEALGLWRGAAFAEFAHEDFARGEAGRLEELRLAAVEEWLEAMIGAGLHSRAAAEATVFVDAHPLRERPRAQLMRAFYADGRQSEALATYQRCRHLLADELGVEPSAALQQLHRDMLRQRVEPLPSGPATPTAPVAPVARSVTQNRAAGPLPGDVPAYQTRFVGRQHDLTALADTLTSTRLLTVLGVGGVGKTRLVAELAHRDEIREHGRVWWCDLTGVTDDGAVAATLAAAVGAHEKPDHSAAEAVAAHLGAVPAVLILDNCEHVVAGVAAVTTALSRAARTRIVATSRVRLGVDGERLYPVAPLPVTDQAAAGGESPAVALFVDRATAVRPGFMLAPEQASMVTTVCQRLDGLPLSIELAAARMGSLNLIDIDDRLDDRFRFLTSPHRTTADRHRTLAKVIDWSYDLLTRTERELFARLSVFTGGFTAASAEAVCAGAGLAPDEVLSTLTALVDASMVAVGGTTGRARYHLLETLRDYGQQRLRDLGDPRQWQDAHRIHFLALAEAAEQRLAGPHEAEAVAQVESELGNLRAAHRRALADGDVDTALRLSTGLHRYALWRLRDEVFRWAEQAAELPGAAAHPAYPALCGVAAWGAALRGDRIAATHLAGRAQETLAPDDPRALRSLEVLMHLALWEGRLEDCLRYCDRAAASTDDPTEFLPYTVRILALVYSGRTDPALDAAAQLAPVADRVGNPTMHTILAYAMAEALSADDPLQAIEHCQRASDLATPVRNQLLLGVTSVTLASLRARHGDTASALRSFRQVIDHLYEGSDWTHLWTGLRSLVELLARAGAHEPAAVLHGAVTGAATAPPVYGDDAERLATVADTLAAALGADALTAARQQGRAMHDHEAVTYAVDAIASAQARMAAGESAATPPPPVSRCQ